MSLHRAVGMLGAFVLACAPAAAQPPAPDLSDLRDAIAAADKKGENVGAIREAFGAFSKALGKSFKPGEPSAELTALRDAVEMALKKGENVEAIGRELGKVEKAVTGREYERPKPPEPAKEPEFQPPVRPGMGRPGFGRDGFPPRRGGVVIGPPGAGMGSTQITISGGNFVVKAKQNDVTYEITGAVAGDAPPKIVIRDGEKKPIEADDVKKVPEEYRPTVEKLLGSVRRP